MSGDMIDAALLAGFLLAAVVVVAVGSRRKGTSPLAAERPKDPAPEPGSGEPNQDRDAEAALAVEATTAPIVVARPRWFRGTAIKVLVAMGAFILMVYRAHNSKETTKALNGAIVGAVVALAAEDSSPDHWRQGDRDLFFPESVWAKREIAGLSGRDLEPFRDCMWSHVTRVIPGGPREANAIGQKRVSEIAKDAGTICGARLASELMNAMEWTPRFARFYQNICITRNGKEATALCACVTREAPLRFATPAQFVKLESTPVSEQSAAERRKYLAIGDICSAATQ